MIYGLYNMRIYSTTQGIIMYICITTAMTVVTVIIQTKILIGYIEHEEFGSNHHNINIILNA